MSDSWEHIQTRRMTHGREKTVSVCACVCVREREREKERKKSHAMKRKSTPACLHRCHSTEAPWSPSSSCCWAEAAVTTRTRETAQNPLRLPHPLPLSSSVPTTCLSELCPRALPSQLQLSPLLSWRGRRSRRRTLESSSPQHQRRSGPVAATVSLYVTRGLRALGALPAGGCGDGDFDTECRADESGDDDCECPFEEDAEGDRDLLLMTPLLTI